MPAALPAALLTPTHRSPLLAQVDGTPPPRAGTPDYFNYNDTYGHGTHTAGIVAGVGNNRQGIAGVNWAVKLLVCRFIWNDGSGYVSDAMNCIKLCKQEGALITSNSWGGIGYSSAQAGSRRRAAGGTPGLGCMLAAPPGLLLPGVGSPALL